MDRADVSCAWHCRCGEKTSIVEILWILIDKSIKIHDFGLDPCVEGRRKLFGSKIIKDCLHCLVVFRADHSYHVSHHDAIMYQSLLV